MSTTSAEVSLLIGMGSKIDWQHSGYDWSKFKLNLITSGCATDNNLLLLNAPNYKQKILS